MKKRFQKKSMWKIVFSLFSMLLLLTNCQDEEMHLDEKSSSIKQKMSVPIIEEAQLYFENFNTNIASYTQHKNSNSKRRNFYVHWKKSRVMEFNPELETQMLYTPILFDKKNLRIKSFLASFKKDKPEITSRIFSIMYHDEHTNEALSGYIFEKDLNGNVLRIYSYEKGLLQSSYTVSEKSGKSKVAAKADNCELSDEDWLLIMEMLEASGGGTFTLLDCVEITASGDDPNDYQFLDSPTISGSLYIPLGDGSSTSTTSTSDTNEIISTDQWWYEETNIDPMENEISITLIEYLPPLTSEQRSFINNPVNDETNIQILNFLQANRYTAEAQDFALNAINAFIDGGAVDFENWTINGQPNCPEGREYNLVSEECECPDGYIEDRNGNCVEKPCVGDPVTNPEIVSSQFSGKIGGTFGCTRSDNTSCNGIQGKKEHDGVDLKANLNSSVFSMYDGTITMIRNSFKPGEYKEKSYGNFIVLTTLINGENINIKYNHLNSVNVKVGQKVNAGDIIGLSGNTGNANPPESSVTPHIHLQVTNSNWTIKYDPFDYMYSSFDSNFNNISNNCN